MCFVQFRIKHTRNAYLIGNYLDLGPCGIEIPQTETEDTVDDALHYFYYPLRAGAVLAGRIGAAQKTRAPRNTRIGGTALGFCGCRSNRSRRPRAGTCLAKPGVDCLSIGPTDLSVNIEAHPQHWLKSVDDTIAYLCKSLQGTGVAVCHRKPHARHAREIRRYGRTVFLENALKGSKRIGPFGVSRTGR